MIIVVVIVVVVVVVVVGGGGGGSSSSSSNSSSSRRSSSSSSGRSDLHLCVPTAMPIVEHAGKSWDSLHEFPEEGAVHCVAL